MHCNFMWRNIDPVPDGSFQAAKSNSQNQKQFSLFGTTWKGSRQEFSFLWEIKFWESESKSAWGGLAAIDLSLPSRLQSAQLASSLLWKSNWLGSQIWGNFPHIPVPSLAPLELCMSPEHLDLKTTSKMDCLLLSSRPPIHPSVCDQCNEINAMGSPLCMLCLWSMHVCDLCNKKR